MVTNRTLMTADELLLMPHGQGKRYELVRGVLIERVAPRKPALICG